MMMTQVSSSWCAMCATIQACALFRLKTNRFPLSAQLRLERHTRAKKASPDVPKGPNLGGDDVLGPFPG